MGETRNEHEIFVGKPERRRLFGRLRSRWEDNIWINLREKGKKLWTGCIWLRIWTSGGLQRAR
jgi:hypothetical protein